MKPPPFLVGAALLFWGWQAGLEIPGALMAVIFEAGRWVKARWDFSNEDFTRIWVFCTLLFLAAAIFAFTSNEGPSEFRGLLQNPNYLTQRNAGTATARTAASLFRWLPMIFFLFAAAQAYSTRDGVPLETISLILRRRWKRGHKPNEPLPPGRSVNISWFYFALCLFSASIHAAENNLFFWGLCLLLGWALWSHRSRRFAFPVWVVCFGIAVGFGYFGQQGVSYVQAYLGNLNPSWLSYFGRRRFDPTLVRTDLGRVGRMKNSAKVVIRLESRTGAPPPLLREASYRSFKGVSWYSEYAEREFLSVLEETNRGVWVLLRDKTNTVSVQIGCYLEGGKALLPSPSGVARYENLSAYTLSRSPLGAVLAEGPGLVVFDALYGPGATIDTPPDRTNDLVVPPRELRAVDQVIDEIGLRGQAPQQALKLLEAFFANQFKYSTWQSLPPYSRTNDTPLGRFLLRTRSGHCEYFASAATLLLRRAGIPARYAVGYAVHERAGEGKFVVRQRDAHAWCLVWDERREIWRDVDFTPASWMETEAGQLSFSQKFSDIWSRLKFEVSRFRWGQTHLREYLLWGVVPILLVLFYQIVRNSRKRRRGKRAGGPGQDTVWPGLDSEFYELERRLARRGFTRLSSEALSDWLERAAREPAIADLRTPLQHLLHMHYRYRFDPLGLTAEERAALRRQGLALLAQIEQLPVSAR
jgi:protein-glutamine gamma-glutamyltransferase